MIEPSAEDVERAKQLLRMELVGAGDGETYTYSIPTLGEIAAAIAAARREGYIEGLRKAEAVLRDNAEFCRMRRLQERAASFAAAANALAALWASD